MLDQSRADALAEAIHRAWMEGWPIQKRAQLHYLLGDVFEEGGYPEEAEALRASRFIFVERVRDRRSAILPYSSLPLASDVNQIWSIWLDNAEEVIVGGAARFRVSELASETFGTGFYGMADGHRSE